MRAIIRRWGVFMGLSALLNLAALALIGHFWRPLPLPVPPAPTHLLLLTLLPPPPKIQPPPPKPRPKPPAPPPAPPRVMATPLPPAPHQPVKIAQAAAGGGSPPRPRPKPKPAKKLHLLDRVAAHADLPQTDKTNHKDQLDDSMNSSDGMDPDDTDPGTAKTPDPGTADGDAPGAPDGKTAGQGEGGQGDGRGPGAALFGKQIGEGGGGKGPRHIVYVLDISGSMRTLEKKFDGRSRIAQAREELDKQFQTLGEGESFSLIAFSDDVHTFRPALVKADPDTIKDAERFLDALDPDGDTDLEDALKAALAMPDVNVVVVITDGVPRTRDLDYSTKEDFFKLATRIQSADAAHVPIFAYGLLGPNPNGTDETQEASDFLSQIAQDSGGQFVEVKLTGERH